MQMKHKHLLYIATCLHLNLSKKQAREVTQNGNMMQINGNAMLGWQNCVNQWSLRFPLQNRMFKCHLNARPVTKIGSHSATEIDRLGSA